MDNSTIERTNINQNKGIRFNNAGFLPDITNKTGSEITAAIFGLQPDTVKEMANVNKMYRSKHGMFSSVPIICSGDDCHYKEVCMVSKQNRIVGKRCPMEVAAILARYEQWCDHFEIVADGDEIDPKDLVDATLIKDMVVIEVQMLRAENKIAINGDFMAEILLDIDKKCKPYFGMAVSPEADFLLSLQDKKIKILNQLNATRKDKSQDKRRSSASEDAIKIFQKIKEMEMAQQGHNDIDIMDAEFDEDGNIIIDEEPNEDNVTQLIEEGDMDGTKDDKC